MAFKSSQDYIQHLISNNELKEVEHYVNPELEITEVADRMIKSNREAILFKNTGTNFPLLINAMGSEKRMSLSLGVDDLEDIPKRINSLFEKVASPKKSFFEKLAVLPTLKEVSAYFPKKKKRKGRCQKVIIKDADLNIFPILKCWPHDGGKFITLPRVHTIDPDNGIMNTGMYRMQVIDGQTTGMHWHLHKDSAHHFNKYKEQGLRMPISVSLGGDPAVTFAASAPLPPNLDEMLLAGFLRKKAVKMVKSITNDIYVPEDSDIIIEGYVDPQEDFFYEGPFGDHTGFYSLADYYPKFHVTCITHRKDAVYPTTIVGIPPQEDAWIGLATERIFLAPIRMTMVPEIENMKMPYEGVFHNIVMASIHHSYSGQAFKVASNLWGAGQMMFNKIFAVFDQDVDMNNYQLLGQLISQNVEPDDHLQVAMGPMDVLDHSSREMSYGSKICIDATTKPSVLAKRQIELSEEEIIENFPEIKSLNSSLLDDQISLLIVGIKKDQSKHVQRLHLLLLNSGYIKGVKFIMYLDENIDINRVEDVIWLMGNNIEPKRDTYLEFYDDESSCLAIDATRKTAKYDGFTRGWPNIIAMTDEVISKVDENWESYQIGAFIESPSLKYKSFLYPGKDTVEE